MLLAFVLLTLFTAIIGGLYVYAELRVVLPVWRRLPARPGLPPDMEYQCWAAMRDFDAGALSNAVVESVELLSPVFGRAHVFAALRGSRLLVYRENTYPGGECGPAVNGVVLTPRWAAVEAELRGVAHAIVHLIERHAGAPDYGHVSWDRRGTADAVAVYEMRWSRLP